MNTIQVDLWIKQRKSYLFVAVSTRIQLRGRVMEPMRTGLLRKCRRPAFEGVQPGVNSDLIVRAVAAAVAGRFGRVALFSLVIARFRCCAKAAFVVARLDG